MGEEYSNTRYRCFEKTGCLITADGSEDNKICPEGLTDYVVPPPLPVNVSIEMEPFIPVPAEDVPDVDVSDDMDELDDIETSEERIDLAANRTINHVLVNRTVNVYYDEWYTGTTTWYNTKLDECRVLYADKSEDYLKLDDFTGVDVILID